MPQEFSLPQNLLQNPDLDDQINFKKKKKKIKFKPHKFVTGQAKVLCLQCIFFPFLITSQIPFLEAVALAANRNHLST